MSESKELVNWEERMMQEAQEVARTERPSVSSISLRSGIIQVMGEPVPNNELKCIVLAFMNENQYFPNDFDPNNIVPPTCFALSKGDDPMLPHEVVKEPINPTCDGCKFMEWGSDRRGGRGKECKEVRRLALIPANGNLTDNEMAMMKIPVMSVKNWSTYVNMLSATLRRPPWGVVTTITTKPDAKSQFRVLFREESILSDEQISAVYPRIEQAYAMLSMPYEPAGEEQEEEEQPKKGGRKKF